MIAGDAQWSQPSTQQQCAKIACNYADALLAELESIPHSSPTSPHPMSDEAIANDVAEKYFTQKKTP